MKTAMQSLLEWAKYRQTKAANNHKSAWNMIVAQIKDVAMEDEKQQITSTYLNAQLLLANEVCETYTIVIDEESKLEAEQYYLTTFKQD